MAKKEKAEEVTGTGAMSITTFRAYDVTIEGMTPLLMNRMLDEMFLSKAQKSRSVKEDKTELDLKIWREKLYFDESGEVLIPEANIKKCLCDGAKDWGGTWKGNSTYTPLVVRSLMVNSPIYLGFNKDETDKNKLDKFTAIVNGNPNNWKGSSKVPRTRPRINSWGGTFRMVVADNRLTDDILKVIISEAGITGIGDHRRLGGFGKFRLTELKLVS